MQYASYEEYVELGGKLTDEEATKALENASDSIDILTYNRINVIGFENLTIFQKGKIKKVCCALADFQTEYDDLIASPLSSYSINGVSVSYNGNGTINNYGGVLLPESLYRQLMQTGLCCGVI